MRSDLAAGVSVVRDPVPPELLDDLTFAPHLVADARRVLGDALEIPIRRVNDDPWVASAARAGSDHGGRQEGDVSLGCFARPTLSGGLFE
jgi:hypothetical protein